MEEKIYALVGPISVYGEVDADPEDWDNKLLAEAVKNCFVQDVAKLIVWLKYLKIIKLVTEIDLTSAEGEKIQKGEFIVELIGEDGAPKKKVQYQLVSETRID